MTTYRVGDALPPSLQRLFQRDLVCEEAKPKRSCRRPTRRDVTRRTIQRLLRAQGNRCSLCGRPMRFTENLANKGRATIEHVVPRAAGGGNAGNRLLAHQACNTRKAGRAPFPCELVLLEAVNLWLGVEGCA